MGEKRADKAPEKTAEGLRRVGVVLYDTDPDQLACITCGQQWQATSLRGLWWRCPNGCHRRLHHKLGLGDSKPTDDTSVMSSSDAQRPRLLCRLGIKHRWRMQRGPEGGRYERCVLCGKERNYPTVSAPPGM